MFSITKDSKIWQWAFFCFVLAGFTGFLYRLGFNHPLPFNLNFENIRHAHSHLMFFGWASLMPLYLVALDAVPGNYATIGARIMKYSLWAILIFGLLFFPFFLFWGYKPVSVGESMLPLSVILSGLVMIGWYFFMGGYLVSRFKKHSMQSHIWFEGALIMLFICSLGAWGVGLTQMLNIGSPLMGKALTHFFLAVFIEGWLVLVLLGLFAKAFDLQENDYVVSPQIIVGLIAFGAPLTFSYGIPESLVNISLSTAARLGGLLIAEGIFLFLYSAVKKTGFRSIWIWPLAFLAIKAVMQLIAAVTPAGMWMSDYGIRILYLHVLLLGSFTTGIIIYINNSLDVPRMYIYIVIGSVALLILSLLLLTRFWPAFLSGIWIYTALPIAAILPVLSIILLWMKMRKQIQT